MTTQINLLPWREQARYLKKVRLLLTLGAFVILTLLLVVIIHLFYKNAISYQQQRNTLLNNKISQSQQLFTELEKMKIEQDLIRKKITFLISLQDNSFRAVRLFNEIPKIIPSNITLVKLQRNQDIIILQGIAYSNLDITALMKKLTQSSILIQPDLTEITTKDLPEENEKMFALKIVQKG